MTEELLPNEIYIQLGENRIGTEICLRRWQDTPFEGGIKYARAQPKYKRVDLEALKKTIISWAFAECQPDKGDIFGWLDDNKDALIDYIKSKYGDLYVVIEK